MAEANDERASRLRIGEWLPPANPTAVSVEAVAEPEPVVETVAETVVVPEPVVETAVEAVAEPEPVVEAVPAPEATLAQPHPPARPTARHRSRPGQHRRRTAGAGCRPARRRNRRRSLASITGPDRTRRTYALLLVAVIAAGALTSVALGGPSDADHQAAARSPQRSASPRPTDGGTPTATADAGSKAADVPVFAVRPAPVGPPRIPAVSPAVPATDRQVPPPAQGTTKPVPTAPTSPPAVGLVLSVEAEGPAARWHGPTLERELPGASGGLVVGHRPAQLHVPAAVRVRFSVVVPVGDYTIAFHYATPDPRLATVTVDGTRYLATFTTTGNGGQDVAVVTLTARLTAGEHVIELARVTGPIPDIDRIVVAG